MYLNMSCCQHAQHVRQALHAVFVEAMELAKHQSTSDAICARLQLRHNLSLTLQHFLLANEPHIINTVKIINTINIIIKYNLYSYSPLAM